MPVTDEREFCFEQPLNERIRTFLRLEHLTTRLRYHWVDESSWGRRATLDALLDVLNVMSRHDIRGQVSKELVQRSVALQRLADHAEVDATTLDRVLGEIDTISTEMASIPPQFASYLLRDNELLNSLNNRHAMPGGTCSFDLPTYHHWLNQPGNRLADDIALWYQRIEPVERGVALLLKLLRGSAEPHHETANNGVLVHNTENDTQMIRVFVDHADVYPEISAGRHRATVRFMQYNNANLHVAQARSTIAFRMACCRF